MIAIKDTQSYINNLIVHHLSAFLTLVFVEHTQLDICSSLNINAIMFASVTHVFFNNALTYLVCHDSMIVYYHYHDCILSVS